MGSSHALRFCEEPAWRSRVSRRTPACALRIAACDDRPFHREFEGIRRYEPISPGHPNLVNLLHVGGTDDCFYYVMELADDAANPKPEIESASFRRLLRIVVESEGYGTNTAPFVSVLRR